MPINSGRVLVLAPHPDDEIIGCAGVLKALADSGVAVKVVIVTDGAAGLPAGTDASVRQAESRVGLRQLGIRDCEFWDYPDGRLPFGGGIAGRYRSLLERYRPSHVFLPHSAESHPDHRSLTRGWLLAAEGHWSGSLWFYETTQVCQPVNHSEDITETLAHKLSALGKHTSQLAAFDYARHCQLLAQIRGLAAGVAAAEAYLVFDWDGSQQTFFAAEPLVSIVVRASDPSLVKHALVSLSQQTYPWIEIVLVWFGEEPAPVIGDLGFPSVVVQGKRNRAANLNAGIEAARGDLIGFLDEDDVFYAGHISELVAELVAQPGVDIAFSGCRVMNCLREGEAVTVMQQVDQFDHRYEPGRLLLGNYITLHSTLSRRNVPRTIPFDPALDAYEDWDFFALAEQRGFRFARVDGLGCEYRLYAAPGAETGLEAAHKHKGYTVWRDVVRSRICQRFSPGDLDRLGSYADRHKQPLERTTNERDEKTKEAARLRGEVAEYSDAAQWVRAAMSVDASLPAAADESVRHLIGRSLHGPVVSVLVPTYDTEPRQLAAMLQSLTDQSYPRWQLCLVDDASQNAETLKVLENFAQKADARAVIRNRTENGGIVAASNEALDLATGEWIAFVDHDDILAPDALLHVALAARRNPSAVLMYTDGRTIDHVGNVLNVFSKPDWSPTTLLSYNYVNHLMVVRRDALVRLGGLRQEYAGAQDWDLLLRLRDELRDEEVVHIRQPLYDWRATNTSLAYSNETKPWAAAAARRALADAVEKQVHAPVTIESSPYGQGFSVEWRGAESPVTVVIPTHSNREGLSLCLRGLLEETDHSARRVLLIANRCSDADMRADLERVAGRPGVTVVEDDMAFNWSALMNRALARVDTEAVLFLNDDVEVLMPDWLARMQRYLDLPGTGAVGAMLFYPDGSLQHGGVETDPQGIAGEVKRSLAPQEAATIRDVSAVTGACMLTTRTAMAQAGGFDEAFPSHYGDIDFCLALRQAGYRVMQAADVRLKHHESATRGRVERADDPEWNAAIARMRRKWGDSLVERYRVSYQVAATTRILTAQA